MFLSYGMSGKQAVKLLAKAFNLDVRESISVNDAFGANLDVLVSVEIKKSGYVLVGRFTETRATVRAVNGKQSYTDRYGYQSPTMRFTSRTADGLVTEMKNTCYNTLAEMLLGENFKLANGQTLSFPAADTLAELKMRLAIIA